MHLRYTRHAEDRLRERGITKQEVESVLRNPYLSYGDGRGNRRFVGEVGGRKIAVVVKGDPPIDPPTIITACDEGEVR